MRIAGVSPTTRRIADESTRSLRPSLHSSSASPGSNRNLVQLHELRIVRRVRLGADVTIDLVAPGMPHRVELGDLVRVLALTDR